MTDAEKKDLRSRLRVMLVSVAVDVRRIEIVEASPSEIFMTRGFKTEEAERIKAIVEEALREPST